MAEQQKSVGDCRRCGEPIYADQFHVCKGKEGEGKEPPVASGNAGTPPAPPAPPAKSPPQGKTAPPPARSKQERYSRDQDIDERLKILPALMLEFPQIEFLRELYHDDREEFWRSYKGHVLKAAAETYKLPMAGVEMPPGHHRPYVNYHGLLVKTQTDPRRLVKLASYPVFYPFDIRITNTPDTEENKFFRGWTPDGIAVFRGLVVFEDGSEFWDEGTACVQSVHMAALKTRLVEMASTRAACRTMRRATGIGLLSVEELEGRGITRPDAKLTRSDARELSRIRDAVMECFFRLKYNAAQQLAACRNHAKVSDVMDATPEGARTLLAALETEDQKRKEKAREGKRGRAGKGNDGKPAEKSDEGADASKAGTP